MRRVVVTGLGLVTPLGSDVETTWANILAGKSGAGPITHFDASEYKCRIACEVKPADHEYGFDPDKRVDHKVQRQVDPFIVFGLDAAGQAIEDAGLLEMDEATRLRAGCSIGSGIGGLPGIEKESLVLAEKGPGRVSPHFVHGRLINLISGQVSIKYGLMGPNHAVVTACSTGAHSIGDAARMIKDGDADIMLAGGAEATICPIGIAGFAQARALSTGFNDEPTRASRPYDEARDGFVMGEGAGVLVLEEYEHAKARGAKIYAELVGFGASQDTYSVTEPDPSGHSYGRAIGKALADANLPPNAVDLLVPCGLGIPSHDKSELTALHTVFGGALERVAMSPIKGQIGNLAAGSGAEAAAALLAIRDGKIPPATNTRKTIGNQKLNVSPEARDVKVNVAVTSVYSLGGQNAALVFKGV
jgi:3-oxoacyl-[acyl-carrier-protein] synthase II